jgi:WD40 repeat protein
MVSDSAPPRLHYSDDFQTISTSSLGDGIRLWSASDKQLLDNVGDDSLTTQMEFSHDGRILAWSNGSYAMFYDLLLGRMSSTPIKAKSWIYSMAVSPVEDTLVATGSSAVELWIRILGDSAHLVVEDFQDRASVFKLAFSQDGQLLAAGLSDGTTHIWQLEFASPTKFEATPLLTVPSTSGEIVALAFPPTGQAVAIANDEGSVRVLNATDGSLLNTFSFHRYVADLSFSPDATVIALGESIVSSDSSYLHRPIGKITAFRISDGMQVWASEEASNGIRDIKFSEDGKSITAGYSDGTVKTYNLP